MPDRNNQPPPPVIDSARVLAYALVDEIEYKKWGALYSGDTLIEKVPRLAICSNLGKDIGPMLFHCDENWNFLVWCLCWFTVFPSIALVWPRGKKLDL
jgi:hypothetical protein